MGVHDHAPLTVGRLRPGNKYFAICPFLPKRRSILSVFSLDPRLSLWHPALAGLLGCIVFRRECVLPIRAGGTPPFLLAQKRGALLHCRFLQLLNIPLCQAIQSCLLDGNRIHSRWPSLFGTQVYDDLVFFKSIHGMGYILVSEVFDQPMELQKIGRKT